MYDAVVDGGTIYIGKRLDEKRNRPVLAQREWTESPDKDKGLVQQSDVEKKVPEGKVEGSRNDKLFILGIALCLLILVHKQASLPRLSFSSSCF
jgi:hypothetical protein